MYRWGFIRGFRFDNGRPFADPTRKSLTPIALHLIGKGCKVKINPPRSPKKNAKVERCQGTTGKWADAAKCADIEEFRRNLEYAVQAQRERLRSRVCGNRTRAEYYPELFRNIRRYDPTDFDLRRVFAHLATASWERQVSSVGTASVFGAEYQVGYKYRNQKVITKLEYEGEKPFWLFMDTDLKPLVRLHAPILANPKYYYLS